MSPERGAVLFDPVERGPDRARYVDAGSLGIGGRFAVPPAEPDGSSELVGDRVPLVRRPCRALAVIRPFGVAQLLVQLVQPRPVLGFRLGIEDRPGVAAGWTSSVIIRRLRSDEVEDVELAPGCAQQRRDVMESLGIAETERRSFERDRPKLTFTAKERRVAESAQTEDLADLGGDAILEGPVQPSELGGLRGDRVVETLDP